MRRVPKAFAASRLEGCEGFLVPVLQVQVPTNSGAISKLHIEVRSQLHGVGSGRAYQGKFLRVRRGCQASPEKGLTSGEVRETSGEVRGTSGEVWETSGEPLDCC